MLFRSQYGHKIWATVLNKFLCTICMNLLQLLENKTTKYVSNYDTFYVRLGMMLNVDQEGLLIYSVGCIIGQLKADLHEHNSVKFGEL